MLKVLSDKIVSLTF